jgi:ABC-type transport system substrate-binding protein
MEMGMTSQKGSEQARRLSRRRFVTGTSAAVAGFAVMGLAGCGDDDTDSGKSIEEKQEEVKSLLSAREDTTAKATKGGIFAAYIAADATNLDPLSSPSFTANVVGGWMYPRLVRFKPGYRVPAKGDVESYLAESWEIPEPTRLTMKLRPNAVWEDKAPLNKRAIDAQDVQFSWEKFAAKAGLRKDLAKLPDNPGGPVESITAVDKNTISIKLQSPYAPLLAALAGYRGPVIMPRESESGGYDPRNETRSGGPWVLADYQRSVKFAFRKNPNYWDAANVFLDGYDMPIVSDYATGLAQFRAKTIWAFAVRQEDILATKRDIPDLSVDVGGLAKGSQFIVMGKQPGSPFLDPRVRQAVSMLLDRDAWIDAFYNTSEFQKAGYPTDVRWSSHISSGFEGHWVDPRTAAMGEGGKYFKKNVAEAKKLLEAAGYPNGIETDFAWIATSEYGTIFPKQAEVTRGMLEESGLFKLKQVNPDYQTEYLPKYFYNQTNFKGMFAHPAGFTDVDQFMFAWYHSTGSRQEVNPVGSPDLKLDGLVTRQRQELDAARRTDVIKEIQQYMATQMHVVPIGGQSPPISLAWPWIGNAGVFRPWEENSSRDSTETKLWFDRSKFTG